MRRARLADIGTRIPAGENEDLRFRQIANTYDAVDATLLRSLSLSLLWARARARDANLRYVRRYIGYPAANVR